ncbi:flavin reductase family protein [Streptomyces sp. NPDC004296]|uniref:flavin reductase family protein n=1 Tax=Streptomyces sp. NPDC004296 TaxID=3364697 RepID=UPI0036890A6B
MTNPPSTAALLDHDTFRSVLGHFPSGVTVVTGGAPDSPAGFTCQSFSSLSLDPPLVVMLPSRSSRSWPAIAASGRFCVNVLAEHQRQLSNVFAHSGTDKFANVRWSLTPLGSPLLAGVSAWIDCAVKEIHPGGDHFIVVGEVRHCGAAATPPLVFHRGRYRGIRDASGCDPVASSGLPRKAPSLGRHPESVRSTV